MTVDTYRKGQNLFHEITETKSIIVKYEQVKSLSIKIFTGANTYVDETDDKVIIDAILQCYKAKLTDLEKQFSEL